MDNIKTMCFRFNLNNPNHLKAWDYLHSVDKEKYKSYTDAVIISITDYFDRQNKINEPYLETRQREDDFVNKIVETVDRKLQKALPEFMLSCLASFAIGNIKPDTVTEQEDISETPDIDWNFLGDE